MKYFFRELTNNPTFESDDLFGRRRLADRLVAILEQSEQPISLLVDGDWGSGKSVFLKKLSAMLRDKKWPVVQIDAFALDYHSQAFNAIAGEVIAIAKEKLPPSSKALEVIKEKSKSVAKILARASIRAATVGILDGTELSSMADEVVKVAGDELDSGLSDIIENRDRERNAFHAFQRALGLLRQEMAEEAGTTAPMVVIIDELDRCRPDFALDVIETVKHLFNLEKVSFLFGMNRTQFHSVVKSRYGNEFDAQTYLQKFFEIEVRLDLEVDDQSNGDRREYIKHLFSVSGWEPRPTSQKTEIIAYLSSLADFHSVSLRDIERCITSFLLSNPVDSHRSIKENLVLAGLAFAGVVQREAYIRLLSGRPGYGLAAVVAPNATMSISARHLEFLRACWNVAALSPNDTRELKGEEEEALYLMTGMFGDDLPKSIARYCRSLNFA